MLLVSISMKMQTSVFLLVYFSDYYFLPLFRESEDTALLLLKDIYDKLGVAFEQPQQ